MSIDSSTWVADNQLFLIASLSRMHRFLAKQGQVGLPGEPVPEVAPMEPSDPAVVGRQMNPPPALLQLESLFHLTTFERDLLLLCAAVDLDSSFGRLLAVLSGDAAKSYPTFGLALSFLPNAHWSALASDSPLRLWRLIEVGSGHSLTQSPLRVDERVLHFIAGVPQLDSRITALSERLAPGDLHASSQLIVLQEILDTWKRSPDPASATVIQLCGADKAGKRDIAASVFQTLGWQPFVMSAELIPAAPIELDTLSVLWRREMRLSRVGLMIDCDDVDLEDSQKRNAVSWFIDRLAAPAIISTRDTFRLRQRGAIHYDINRPSRDEQRQIWQAALGNHASQLNGSLEALTSQFNLSTSTIYSAAERALAKQVGSSAAEIEREVWDAARDHARPELEELAQRLDPAATWNDLVLPEPQRQLLQEIAIHVRNRGIVYDKWKFSKSGSRGLGISALFAGASGTGKTMAAEVIANALRLDLYRIDLSSVVSKYIGETEKNLRRIFDAADSGGAILLFDEADALFGKRSEVKDSHDRYANVEVSYLLQRMETYQGLAILTTNFKSALDTAFLRRIRFVVQFPFPDAQQRSEIWRRIFPPEAPTGALDFAKLARLNVTGGNIRNIALGAAFLAAESRQPIGMDHLLHAARTEYAKIEKPLTESEIAGWV